VVPKGHDALANCAKALKRHLGDLQPHHLTKERIRFYRRQRAVEGYEVGREGERRRKPVKDGTILKELVTLRTALRFAKNTKWITEEPHIEVPSQPAPRDRWLTREEAQKLVAGAKLPHVRLFLATALYTAARPSAVLELTWDRVDLQAGRIDLGAGTGNKRRAVVPIAPPLLPILQEARQMATCPYVVEYGGKPVASIKKGVHEAARRAGLAGVSPGVLRHTAATWMAMAGISIDEIAQALGHTNPRITRRVYAKYQPDYLKGAMAALAG
jgi:integrase